MQSQKSNPGRERYPVKNEKRKRFEQPVLSKRVYKDTLEMGLIEVNYLDSSCGKSKLLFILKLDLIHKCIC